MGCRTCAFTQVWRRFYGTVRATGGVRWRYRRYTRALKALRLALDQMSPTLPRPDFLSSICPSLNTISFARLVDRSFFQQARHSLALPWLDATLIWSRFTLPQRQFRRTSWNPCRSLQEGNHERSISESARLGIPLVKRKKHQDLLKAAILLLGGVLAAPVHAQQTTGSQPSISATLRTSRRACTIRLKISSRCSFNRPPASASVRITTRARA